MHVIRLSDAFAVHVKAVGRKPCSIPILLDMSVNKDEGSLDETQYSTWLSEEERRHHKRLTLAKRRKEWLAGRICAKFAIDDYFRTYGKGWKLPPWAEVTISNSDTGRPYAMLVGGERLPGRPDISISHSGEFALALVAQTFCGVDIQKTSPTLVRVKERFCADQEERLLTSALRKSDHLMSLARLWAAKEAAKKALSITAMPGFLDLILADIEETGKEEHIFVFSLHSLRDAVPSEVRVASTCHQLYGLGVCIP